MCDTLVIPASASPDGATWLAKNSDRAPNEAQNVLHLPARAHAPGATVRCTWLELPQAPRTAEVALSQPHWMWGAEMGVNAHGLAIGNEAVFTHLPVADVGLLGMDLLRLALERTTTALDALDLITDLLDRFGQGGPCDLGDSLRYHNAFLIADPTNAWVLETADRFWVAERVRSTRSISNVLTIGKRFDRLSAGALPFARAQGWCRGAADFDFAACFGDPLYRHATGGLLRRHRTEACAAHTPHPTFDALAAALRDHADDHPADGWRMHMPCAHASWPPTRHHGQTTASMIAHLTPTHPRAWFTGTSSPCLSVFKPVVFGGDLLDTGTLAGARADHSLWWRHERLHRLTLDDYTARAALLAPDRLALEARAHRPDLTLADAQALWDDHRAALPAWTRRLEASPAARPERRWFRAFWAVQSRRAGLSKADRTT